jgi:hypothetical protein
MKRKIRWLWFDDSSWQGLFMQAQKPDRINYELTEFLETTGRRSKDLQPHGVGFLFNARFYPLRAQSGEGETGYREQARKWLNFKTFTTLSPVNPLTHLHHK